ncbi:unnamed protein product, partial [Meganyctiphanes norvegica]
AEETPRVGSSRGSLPGLLLAARKKLFKKTYKNADRAGSPDMFPSSNEGDVGPSTSRGGAGIARRGRGSRGPRATGRSRVSGTSSTDSESGAVRPGDVGP